MFINLSSELTLLKAGLIKVKEWMETSHEAHHQLIMDLDSVLVCCKTLVDTLDGQLEGLRRNRGSSGQLSRLGKLKLVLGRHSMEDIQKMIERQTNTLTLLLTACNRYSIFPNQARARLTRSLIASRLLSRKSYSKILAHVRPLRRSGKNPPRLSCFGTKTQSAPTALTRCQNSPWSSGSITN